MKISFYAPLDSPIFLEFDEEQSIQAMPCRLEDGQFGFEFAHPLGIDILKRERGFTVRNRTHRISISFGKMEDDKIQLTMEASSSTGESEVSDE